MHSPVALLYLEDFNSCNNIGDIFWSSSISKKKIHDRFFPTGVDHAGLLELSDLSHITNQEDRNFLFDIHIGLAAQLEDSGLSEYSSKHYHQALKLQKENHDLIVRSALAVPPIVYDSVQHIEETRHSLEENLENLLNKRIWEQNFTLESLNHLNTPGTFYFVYMGYNDLTLLTKLREAYRLMYRKLERVYYSTEGYSLPSSVTPSHNSNDDDQKIRIGFASHYFRQHSICKLVCGLITGLDRKKFHVTIFSSTSDEDEMTQSIKERSDHFINLSSDGMILKNRHIAYDQDLDILVYPDIGMSSSSLWAQSRLAKIQVCFWGHPQTTGMKNMDYFISSDLFEDPKPELEERYIEQYIRMDSLSYYFQYPKEATLLQEMTEEGSSDFDFTSLGIPEGSKIILCPQTLPKFHPQFDIVLDQLLNRNEDAFIVSMYNKDKVFWKNKLLSRFRSTSQHAERFKMIPSDLKQKDFFRLLQSSTILIDPFPFGGGVTSLEAFSLCKAVVTAPRLQSVPQLTKGMILAMEGNLTISLITETIEKYIDTASQLLSNESYRIRVEEEICKNHHKLYDQKGVIKEWETLFHNMIKTIKFDG